MDPAARKAQLLAWITASERNRGRIAAGAGITAVAGVIAAVAIHGVIGAVITTGAIAFGVCGAWITTAHILTFRGQIKDLEAGRLEPQVIHVKQGRGRYQR